MSMELTKQQVIDVLSDLQSVIAESKELTQNEDGFYEDEDIEEVQNTINLASAYLE